MTTTFQLIASSINHAIIRWYDVYAYKKRKQNAQNDNTSSYYIVYNLHSTIVMCKLLVSKE